MLWTRAVDQLFPGSIAGRFLPKKDPVAKRIQTERILQSREVSISFSVSRSDIDRNLYGRVSSLNGPSRSFHGVRDTAHLICCACWFE
jgi:hypothetical protein